MRRRRRRRLLPPKRKLGEIRTTSKRVCRPSAASSSAAAAVVVAGVVVGLAGDAEVSLEIRLKANMQWRNHLTGEYAVAADDVVAVADGEMSGRSRGRRLLGEK